MPIISKETIEGIRSKADVFKAVQKALNISFVDAIKWLAVMTETQVIYAPQTPREAALEAAQECVRLLRENGPGMCDYELVLVRVDDMRRAIAKGLGDSVS